MSNDVEIVVVSVLITFYNQEAYVDRAIQSVLNQDAGFAVEILAGDDGSSDGTLLKLNKWRRRKPDIIRVFQWERDSTVLHEPIQRASANRLRLLERARGKYIVFLDGDDYFSDASKLGRQVEALETHAECLSCCHNVTYRLLSGESRSLVSNWVRSGTMRFSTYWSLLYTHVMSFMFRAEAVQMRAIDRRNFDDNTIVFSLARKGSVYYIADSMAVYEQVKGSSWEMRNSVDCKLLNIKDFNFEKEAEPALLKASVFRHLDELAWLLNNGGEGVLIKKPLHVRQLSDLTLKINQNEIPSLRLANRFRLCIQLVLLRSIKRLRYCFLKINSLL